MKDWPIILGHILALDEWTGRFEGEVHLYNSSYAEGTNILDSTSECALLHLLNVAHALVLIMQFLAIWDIVVVST